VTGGRGFSIRQGSGKLAVPMGADPQPPATSATAPERDPLTDDELRSLHELALLSLAASVHARSDAGDEIARGMRLPARLSRPGGAFVTLTAGGELRGCIGLIQTTDPLWRNVIRMAAAAALHDRRFPPVRPDELQGLVVEVSVLSPLAPLPSWEAFRPGEEGIVLRKELARAVFLPEVAREEGWSREETLSQLCRKAGLEADDWREGATFEVFTTQIHKAPFAAGGAR
jgi:AmmeMemoRadiSam system protein A